MLQRESDGLVLVDAERTWQFLRRAARESGDWITVDSLGFGPRLWISDALQKRLRVVIDRIPQSGMQTRKQGASRAIPAVPEVGGELFQKGLCEMASSIIPVASSLTV